MRIVRLVLYFAGGQWKAHISLRCGLGWSSVFPIWAMAVDTRRAVISTIGIIRSYAIRVGPMTPRVPTIRPLIS